MNAQRLTLPAIGRRTNMKHRNADAVRNVTTRKRGVVTNVKKTVKGAVKNAGGQK